MSKYVIAIGLGFLSLFVAMIFGESGNGDTGKLIVGFIAMGVFLFVCQFFLSRGHVRAYRKDWPIMLALDATILICVVIMAFVERREVVLSQGPAFLIFGCGGTYCGAIAASLLARRKSANQQINSPPQQLPSA